MTQRKVLLIDYEPRSIEDTRRPLVEAGYQVEVAHDGVSGLEAFHRFHPDLVLVEAMLPKKHGFDVCREIKESDVGRDTPVVITTGVYRGRKYRNQALRNFGCDEYLEKPFTDDALLDACNRFIHDEVEAARAEATTPAVAAAPVTATEVQAAPERRPAVLDLEKMTEDEISDRLDSLLADFGEAVDRASDSVETNAAAAAPPADPAAAESSPVEVAAADAPSALAASPEAPVADRAPVAPSEPVDVPAVEPAPAPTVARPAEASVTAPPRPVATAADAIAPLPGRELPAPRPALEIAATSPSKRRAPAMILLAVVGFAVVGGVVAWRWFAGDGATDRASVPPAREPVTFESTLARERADGLATEQAPGLDATANGPDVDGVATGATEAGAGATGASPTVPDAPPTAPPETVAATRPEPTSRSVAGQNEPAMPAAAVVRSAPAAVVETAPATSEPRAAVPTPAVAKPTTADGAVVDAPSGVPAESAAPATDPVESRPNAVASEVAAALAGGLRIGTGGSPLAATEAADAGTSEPRSGAADRVRRGAAPIEPPQPVVRRGDLLPLTLVDVPPVAVEQPAPTYHPMARQLRQEGTVVVNVLIDEDGAVADVQVLREIPNSKLNDAAVKAVRRWRYEPASKDGVAVRVWKTEAIHFRL